MTALADLARVLSDVPSGGARAPVGVFEPVRRGSARPLDPERPTAPFHAHPRPLGVPDPVGWPAPDVPPRIGVRVTGAGPAGLGGGLMVDEQPTHPCCTRRAAT
jgi:hypothetical protein